MRSIFALILSRLKQLFAFIFRKEVTVDPKPDDPDIEGPINGDDVYVCYYGCPNSKRTQKLQLSRKLYR